MPWVVRVLLPSTVAWASCQSSRVLSFSNSRPIFIWIFQFWGSMSSNSKPSTISLFGFFGLPWLSFCPWPWMDDKIPCPFPRPVVEFFWCLAHECRSSLWIWLDTDGPLPTSSWNDARCLACPPAWPRPQRGMALAHVCHPPRAVSSAPVHSSDSLGPQGFPCLFDCGLACLFWTWSYSFYICSFYQHFHVFKVQRRIFYVHSFSVIDQNYMPFYIWDFYCCLRLWQFHVSLKVLYQCQY